MRVSKVLNCRACGSTLKTKFVDLGISPISNAFPRIDAVNAVENVYPLRAFVCSSCRLVQLEDFGSREIHFKDDYAYFSSISTSWMKHASDYAAMIVERLGLNSSSKVVEIASNDGYLLKNFVERGIPCLGIDPAANCAAAAKEKFGVDTHVGFFGAELGRQLASSGWTADLMIANNVIAHVPDVEDFISGFAHLLNEHGVITFEFPHILEMIDQTQYDTIYHEHYSYISLLSLEKILGHHGLRVFDAQKLTTHGGSLRLFACREKASFAESEALNGLRRVEHDAGINTDALYADFAETVSKHKRDFLTLLIGLKEKGAKICGYGAAAKGTTLLNYCGVGTDMIDFVVDRNPFKQGRLVPGTGIPIYAPEMIEREKPDYVLILPWNLKAEIMSDMAHIRDWGGRFITPIPHPVIID